MSVLDGTIPPAADPSGGFGANSFQGITLARFARVMVMVDAFTEQQAADFADQLGFEVGHME